MQLNNVIDEVLAGDARYKIYDPVTNTIYFDGVAIDLITSAVTTGTPLNKLLFDSIRDDLNSRLLIDSKANQAEAEAGLNDTKYMTPLKVKYALDKLCKITTYDIPFDSNSHSLDSLITSNTYKVVIEGFAERYDSGSDFSEWHLPSFNDFYGITFSGSSSSSLSDSSILDLSNGRYNASFKLEIDVKNKLFELIMYHGNTSSKYITNNDYTIVKGLYSSDTLGDLKPRKLADGYNGTLKVRVYDSPTIMGGV